MLTPETQWFLDMVDGAIADMLFWLILLIICAAILVALFFLALLLRAVWRWLARATWNNVIVSIERKALASHALAGAKEKSR